MATKKAAVKKDQTVLEEAQSLIYGDRQQSYGSAKQNFKDTATGWSVILSKRNEDYVEVTPEDVAMMMVWLKVCRQNNKPGRDNIVDICGYAGCVEKIEKNL